MNFRSLNRLAFVAALAFSCVVLTDGERAQPAPSPGGLAAAKELVRLRGAGAMFDPLIPGVIEAVKNQFLPTNSQLVEPLNEVAAQLRKEYEPKRAEIVDQVAKIYAENFTEQELKGIIGFYKTPIGQKMLIKEPVVTEQSLRATQLWANQFADAVLERFRTEMQKRGYKL